MLSIGLHNKYHHSHNNIELLMSNDINSDNVVSDINSNTKREYISYMNNFLKTSSLIGLQSVLMSFSDVTAAAYASDNIIKDDNIMNTMIQYNGESKPLKQYLGDKCTLIVNVASQCALTPQYDGLVSLYNDYHDQGFNIIAFPCNQFGSQEPSPVEKIRKDMLRQFNVQFPIMDKIDVNGPNTHPLYNQLKSYKDIGVSNIVKISWNFEKFLVNSNGIPIRRYKPGFEPESIKDDIHVYLKTGLLNARKKTTLNDY